MRWLAALLLVGLLAGRAGADMYQDGSNAKQPQALNAIGKAGGTFFAPAYGSCTWGTTTDVGACVNAAIEAAYAAGGGTVILPTGTHGVSTTIATSRNGIAIACNSPSGGHYAYTVTGGCTLKWVGAAGGRVMSLTSGGTRHLTGIKLDNIKFDGNNGLAADGLLLSGVFGGEFRSLRFVGGFNGGKVLALDVPTISHNPTTIGTQHNQFYSTAIHNNGYSSTGLYLGFYWGPAVGPDVAANASANNFYGTQIGSGGKPLHCLGCDNNHFEEIWLGADTGPALDLDIYNANGRIFGANGNIFRHVAWIGHEGIARGTTSVPGCIPMSYPVGTTCTYGNTFEEIDGTNGSGPPTVEAGAFARWNISYGGSANMNSLMYGDGQRPVQTIFSSYGATNTCGADALAFGAGTGSYYCGGGWNMQYYSNSNPVNQAHFGLGLSSGAAGTENLVWRRWAGTGFYDFNDAPIRLQETNVSLLPACNAARTNAMMVALDQLSAPTYRGALTGGGSIRVLAYCNGTSWEAH